MKDKTKEKKEERKRAKIFVAGAETAIYMIRRNMGGSSLRMFDLHTFELLSLLRQLKKTYHIRSRKNIQIWANNS